MKSIHGKLLWTTSWVFALLAALVSPLASSASPSTQRDYTFDTSASLTDNFNIKVGPQTTLSQISVQQNWGLNGSGGLKIDIGSGDLGNRAAIFSTKERYTVKNSPIDSVYKFSLYARSHQSGYAGIGFTANADDSTSGIYPDYFTPKDALGVSMHGGAFIIHNGTQKIERSWNSASGNGVTTLTAATCSIFVDSPEFVPANATADDCASPSGWYRLDLTLTKKSSTTFDLKLEVFRSSSTGDVSSTGLAADTSAPNAPDAAFQILGLSNPAIGNSGSLASYINMSGKRFPQIDGYKIDLAGAKFVTAPSAPGTPTATPKMTTVAPIVGEVELEWTAPTSGDAPFTYTVTSVPPLPAGATCTVTGVKASCVGLTGGTQYSFIVEASNEGGSATSASSAQVTFPHALPSTPGAPTAVAGDASASVSWPASSAGTSPITYTVESSPAGGTCVVTGLAANCTGLTNGTAYTFTVKATTPAGNATSVASNSVTPSKLPGIPGVPTVAPGDKKITVTPTAPTTGTAPTSYLVTSAPGGKTCTVTLPATSCDVTGLTNGTSYTFTTRAINANGSSAPSQPSAAVKAGIPDVGPTEDDGNVPAKTIGSTGAFVPTNDPTFLLSWNKASGKLGSRATGIYTGYIQAVATFTVAGKTHTCSTVFGTLKAMPMKTAAQKTASMKSKTFTGKQFCIDKIKMDAKTLAPKGGMTSANFKKIKSMNKTSSELAKEKLALAALKNFTGEVRIQVTRYRAWPTTMVNIGDHNSRGGKIPFLVRNTKVNLG